MPKFSDFFNLALSQHQLDFVDVSNECDTPVYVDPYAIEIRDDIWAEKASESIRSFFLEVLDALRNGDKMRAQGLMSHLHEPSETFLGVSKGKPSGRGVGFGQTGQLIRAMEQSKAFQTGMLQDLSEMALYVEGIDRDKISDLTTNIIRKHLVEYTEQQCAVFDIQTKPYIGPPYWCQNRANWVSAPVHLPYIEDDAVILVPKYIVRRKLSLDSQEFYNKQITDFLVAENLKANSSLVQVVKGRRKITKGAVRKQHPKSKPMIADMVSQHPELLEMYKDIAKRHGAMVVFNDDEPSIHAICQQLSEMFDRIPSGRADADAYHQLVLGSLTALFYPSLINPHKEWEINDGRKRVDIVYTNAADTGFFAQRRNDQQINANTVIVECKNYKDDLANEEIDQLLGRFDNNRGKFGIMACRSIDDKERLLKRCRDAAVRSTGYIIVLTDEDVVAMLQAKATLNDRRIEEILHQKFRDLIA